MKKHPQARLLLNGDISYHYLQKYIHVANKQNISFSIVENKNSHTDIGIVLTYDYAVNYKDINIEKENRVPKNNNTKKKSIFEKLKLFLQKWFKN